MRVFKVDTRIIAEVLYGWSQRFKIPQKLVGLLLLVAMGAGVATYTVFTSSALLGENSRKVIYLLNVDLVILLLLGFLISRRLVKLWAQRRSGRAGSKLHLRLALIFGVLTVIPTLFVAVSSALLFNEGIQAWFNERVRTALNESSVVAEAYFEEHKKSIMSDVLALALRFSENFERYAANQDYFNQELDKECFMISLNEGIVFGLNHQIYARTRLSFSLEFESLSLVDLQRANEKVVIQTSESGDRVRAFTRIPHTDAFIIAGRYLDNRVLKRINNTRDAVSEYNQLEALQSDLEIKLAVSFMIVALILLLAAVWMGLLFADHMVRPISELIFAAESVRQGNYTIRVSEKTSDDEISILSRAFNRMTTELKTQQKELVEANQQIDQRRQFIEDVLEGVTAGVIELSVHGQIRLLNRSAVELLSLGDDSVIGRNIESVVPEMMDYLAEAFESKSRFYQAELSVTRHGFTKMLLVRVVLEYTEKALQGFIVTFDDVTALMAAQRKAAWSDVARRIAHEIKNPLTPIQLSAERLRRKYLKDIQGDRANFETCIDTIVRQVDHMERLVSEFSSFARMPNPVMVAEDLVELCQQAIYLQKSAYPHIEFRIECADKSLKVLCDSSQMDQVFTNLLQNAIDSIESFRQKNNGDPLLKGCIVIALFRNQKRLTVTVEDNGEGFPDNRFRLLDPYVTLREKGTGLGLAIVKKIVEDHSGELSLENKEERGARVRMSFPVGILVKTPEVP
jgi:two-component system, NtrC family, nitrogen regulation sensor histidine kinase NtrY